MKVLALMIVGTSLAMIVPAFAETTPQPLTRADCEKAGMHWNDNANVCGGQQATNKPEAKAEKPKKK